jgi:hypothetical protein
MVRRPRGAISHIFLDSVITALKMLRECGASPSLGIKEWSSPPSMGDDVRVLKDYVFSCLEKTAETVEDEMHGDPFSCIWHGVDEECYFQ